MNDTQPQKNNIKSILEKIQNNELVLKPKTYFRLKFVALIVLLVLIVIVSLFLSSFIFFSLQASGHAALMGFGPTGWQVFFALFPWKILLFEIALIILLEYFLRSFRFGYRVPVLYLFLGVVVLVCAGALVVNKTPFHMQLLRQADREMLPAPFRGMYQDIRRPPARGSGIFRGVVVEIKDGIFVVALDNPRGIGTTTLINVTQEAIGPNELEVGDKILIRGKMMGGMIRAMEMRR